MKIKYQNIAMGEKRLAVVKQANSILEEYVEQGFTLTLRQLYYQFVARGFIPNVQQEYKRLGDIINDARLAGLVDWNHMEDRTRNVRSLASWDDPASIVDACASQFRIDMWAKQDRRIEVWVEKDALVGVIEGVCNELRVPHFSCRGYTSQSEMWGAAQRLLVWRERKQTVTILHLGDHDPSGIDMSRDIQDRLNLFMRGDAPEFERLALNMPQIEEFSPPPNPAKSTDARYAGYVEQHGDESWELDALEPMAIAALIRKAILSRTDSSQWKADTKKESEHRRQLKSAGDRWDDVCGFLADRAFIAVRKGAKA